LYIIFLYYFSKQLLNIILVTNFQKSQSADESFPPPATL